ncbi:MAG TPA: hypothetical protein PLJ21_10100 [Pseudobdellovibrionaceae bacterium]|nr:hypothetical protein [Pseudobdellovibrionaceae bacterium]
MEVFNLKCETTTQKKTITVGEIQNLKCQGDIPKEFNFEKAHVQSTPEEKYNLQILKINPHNSMGSDSAAPSSSSSEVQLEFTSYVVGQHQIPQVILTDGIHSFSIGPLDMNVQSVMNEIQPPPQEPYGPMGLFQVEVPFLFLYLVFSIIGLVLFIFLFKIWKTLHWKRILEKLKEHDSAQTPENQFYQNLRKIQRSSSGKIQEQLKDLNTYWRLFILRKYKIPAFDWNVKEILKYVKKKDPLVFKQSQDELIKIFHEFEKALKDLDKTSKRDLILLMDHSRHLVDLIHKNKVNKEGGR